MNSYEFSKFYSGKVIKIVRNLIDGKKYKNCKNKNGYKFNMKSYGFRTNFWIEFVSGTLRNGDLFLYDDCRGFCTTDFIRIPIFHNDKVFVDLDYLRSVLIHEFTHCYQKQYKVKFESSEDDYYLWLADENEQEAILNQFQFGLECEKSFGELLKIRNFNELYKWYPGVFKKFRKV
jgi:hypothetical protein